MIPQYLSISLYYLLTNFFLLAGCNQNGTVSSDKVSVQSLEISQDSTKKTAYFASGCFWCVEAVFESVKGVDEAISGYAGGTAEDAHYEIVSAGTTDHAESVAVIYDPAIVDYETLLVVFFGSHDPTTLNRQGPDAGRQYRSAIFFTSDAEKKLIEDYMQKLYADATFKKGSITTEVSPLTAFYPAEDYHQNYERNNPNQPYVRSVSVPRLNKFKAAFPELLKSGEH